MIGYISLIVLISSVVRLTSLAAYWKIVIHVKKPRMSKVMETMFSAMMARLVLCCQRQGKFLRVWHKKSQKENIVYEGILTRNSSHSKDEVSFVPLGEWHEQYHNYCFGYYWF